MHCHRESTRLFVRKWYALWNSAVNVPVGGSGVRGELKCLFFSWICGVCGFRGGVSEWVSKLAKEWLASGWSVGVLEPG
jgi:hypothetical protein